MVCVYLNVICINFSCNVVLVVFQSVGLPKWSSTVIRNQDVHSNGTVLDDVLLSDPEVMIL